MCYFLSHLPDDTLFNTDATSDTLEMSNDPPQHHSHIVPIQPHPPTSTHNPLRQEVHKIPISVQLSEPHNPLPSEYNPIHTIPVTVNPCRTQIDGLGNIQRIPVHHSNYPDSIQDETELPEVQEEFMKITKKIPVKIHPVDLLQSSQPYSESSATDPHYTQNAHNVPGHTHTSSVQNIHVHNQNATNSKGSSSSIQHQEDKIFGVEETKSRDSGITSRGSSWQSGSFKEHISNLSPGSYSTMPVKKAPSSIGDKSSIDGMDGDIEDMNDSFSSATLPNIKPLKTSTSRLSESEVPITSHRGYESDFEYVSKSNKNNTNCRWVPQEPQASFAESGYLTDVDQYSMKQIRDQPRHASERDYQSDAESSISGNFYRNTKGIFGTLPKKYSPVKFQPGKKMPVKQNFAPQPFEPLVPEERDFDLIDKALDAGPNDDCSVFSEEQFPPPVAFTDSRKERISHSESGGQKAPISFPFLGNQNASTDQSHQSQLGQGQQHHQGQGQYHHQGQGHHTQVQGHHTQPGKGFHTQPSSQQHIMDQRSPASSSDHWSPYPQSCQEEHWPPPPPVFDDRHGNRLPQERDMGDQPPSQFRQMPETNFSQQHNHHHSHDHNNFHEPKIQNYHPAEGNRAPVKPFEDPRTPEGLYEDPWETLGSQYRGMVLHPPIACRHPPP